MGDVATVAEEEGREEDEWGFTAVPHTTADPVIDIYGADIMIPVTTPETQLAAWIFIKWFTSPEIQAEWVRISNYFPVRHSAADLMADYFEANPTYKQAFDLLEYSTYEAQWCACYEDVRRLMSDAACSVRSRWSRVTPIWEGCAGAPALASMAAMPSARQRCPVSRSLRDGQASRTLPRRARCVAGSACLARSSSAARSAIGMAEMLAHEIKNPLAGITGAAQYLGMNLSGEDREMTDLIVAETRRIVKLLEQVEQFGNLRPPLLKPVNIHDIRIDVIVV